MDTRPKFPFALLLLTLLLGLTALALNLANKTRNHNIQSKTNVDLPLSIIRVAPQQKFVSTTKPQISFTFNYPITPHHAAEYISFSPPVTGKFDSGATPNQLIFTPTQSFRPGTSVRVTALAGLPSDIGKRLQTSYSYSFTIKPEAGAISLLNNGLTGKFFSFSKDTGATLSLRFGPDVSNASVKVFAASKETLLNSLIYTKEAVDWNDNPGGYSEAPIDTSKLQQVKTFTNLTDEGTIHFTGPTGIYLFQAQNEDQVTTNLWVSLNETGIHFRQDDKNIYLAAQDLTTTQPSAGYKIEFYELEDKPRLISSHTLSGLQHYPFPVATRLDLIVATRGQDTLVVPVLIPNSQAEIRSYKDLDSVYRLFLYTDRPIYKPGDKLSFRGIARVDNDASYKIGPLPKEVDIAFANSNLKLDQKASIDSQGVFSGEITLPDDLSPNLYYLYARIPTATDKYSNYTTAYFEVKNYTKPEFDLDIQTTTQEFTRGDTISLDVSGSLFAGGPLSNGQLNLSIYKRDFYETEKAVYNEAFNLNSWGGMCGGSFGFDEEYYGTLTQPESNLSLDSSGKAHIDFDTKVLGPGTSQELTFVVSKTDSVGNKVSSAKNIIVHQGTYSIFLRPVNQVATSGVPFPVAFYAEDSQGNKLGNKKFTYTLSTLEWTGNKATTTPIFTKEITTTDKGTGSFEVTYDLPQTKNYQNLSISVETLDTRGNIVSAQNNIPIYQKPSKNSFQTNYQPLLQIVSEANNLVPNTQNSMTITAPADMTVLASFERGRVYEPQWLALKAGKNTFSYFVKDTFSPSITPTFSYFWQGVFHIEGLSLNVPAMHKLLTVKITTDKPSYSPGETANITITTLDPDGNPTPASLGVGIVDKAIFALRKNTSPPLHSAFYNFRNRSTNSSSSLTGIGHYGGDGGMGGGGGDVDNSVLGQDIDTLYWNPSLSTNSSGQLTIPVQLGQTRITWRILTLGATQDSYLGQAELDIPVTNQP